MMKIVDRGGFKMYVHIGDCKAPDETKVIHFIREEHDSKENILTRNTYEFFMNKDEMKKLAKVLNDYE